MTNFLILAGVGLGCYSAGVLGGKLFDNGLANSLCVETLRHGTNLGSYLSIRVLGGEPAYGGSCAGSTHGEMVDSNVATHFYVFKDNEYPYHEEYGTSDKIKNFFYKWFGARRHAFASGYNAICAAACLPAYSDNCVIKCLRVFFGTIGGIITLILTPILKFRVAEIDPQRFKNDPEYRNSGAYMTTQKIEAWRIGILGTLLTGVNCQWHERFNVYPAQLVIGVLQTITSLAIFAIAIYFTLHAGYKPALVLGACAGGFVHA